MKLRGSGLLSPDIVKGSGSGKIVDENEAPAPSTKTQHANIQAQHITDVEENPTCIRTSVRNKRKSDEVLSCAKLTPLPKPSVGKSSCDDVPEVKKPVRARKRRRVILDDNSLGNHCKIFSTSHLLIFGVHAYPSL